MKAYGVKKVYYSLGGTLDNIEFGVEKVRDMASTIISFGNRTAFGFSPDYDKKSSSDDENCSHNHKNFKHHKRGR
jgi:hypothetical protein